MDVLTSSKRERERLLLEYEMNVPLEEIMDHGPLVSLFESISEELDLNDLRALIELRGKGKEMVVRTLAITVEGD